MFPLSLFPWQKTTKYVTTHDFKCPFETASADLEGTLLMRPKELRYTTDYARTWLFFKAMNIYNKGSQTHNQAIHKQLFQLMIN